NPAIRSPPRSHSKTGYSVWDTLRLATPAERRGPYLIFLWYRFRHRQHRYKSGLRWNPAGQYPHDHNARSQLLFRPSTGDLLLREKPVHSLFPATAFGDTGFEIMKNSTPGG